MTIDARVGYCGGMNLKENDWDTTVHDAFDVRRFPHDAGPGRRTDAAHKRQLPGFHLATI